MEEEVRTYRPTQKKFRLQTGLDCCLFLTVVTFCGLSTIGCQQENRQAQDSVKSSSSADSGTTSDYAARAETQSEIQEESVESESEIAGSDQQPADNTESRLSATDNEKTETQEHTIDIPKTWKRLFKNEVWVDFKSKQVIVGGMICFEVGPLEMFACPVNTKEHESVVATNALSSEVHAALLAVGADKGTPAQWDPEYKPATGPVIDVQVTWFDEDEKKTVTRSARSMIRDSRTGQPMTHQWVFGGSQIWEDPDTGDKIYYGDAGELICVSNFSTATMDLNVKSSQSNDGLLFEALTENIPPIGTKVYLVLTPGEKIGTESIEEQTAEESSATGSTDGLKTDTKNTDNSDGLTEKDR